MLTSNASAYPLDLTAQRQARDPEKNDAAHGQLSSDHQLPEVPVLCQEKLAAQIGRPQDISVGGTGAFLGDGLHVMPVRP